MRCGMERKARAQDIGGMWIRANQAHVNMFALALLLCLRVGPAIVQAVNYSSIFDLYHWLI